MELSLVSLNIEKDRHLDLLIPFLKQMKSNNYEVFALQEVYREDIEEISQALGFKASFFPMCMYYDSLTGKTKKEGCALLYKEAPDIIGQFCYYKDVVDLPVFDENNTDLHAGVIIAEFTKGSDLFRIATTHMPAAPNGGTDLRQRTAVGTLMEYLEQYDDLILCGDFNAPRGKEVFSKIAQKYHDNIPPEISTSIDGDLHRSGALEFMVDGLFTSCHYKVSGVELVSGISDHKAITAQVSRNN